MHHSTRFFAGLSAFALLILASGTVAAATTTKECGLFRDYTAPDPIGDVPGSITFGLSGGPETIAPDATLVPPTDTALPGLQGGVPTCLTVIRDAGVITSLEFAASGTVSGSVVFVADLFGPGADAYVIADRIFTPVSSVTDNDGLAALIKTAADAGTTLSITFQIDLSTGVPTGFTATTTLTGVVDPQGVDIMVGAATLPSSVIDSASRAALHQAANLGTTATVVVDGVGTLDQSASGGVAIGITLTVTFEAPAATPTPTPSPEPLPDTAASQGVRDDGRWLALTAFAGALLAFLPAVGYLAGRQRR